MDIAAPTMPEITGRTALIAHLGHPTESFKAPMIYNPWFAAAGIDAVVVPMGVRAEDYAAFLPLLFRLSNIRGALVTMPHKVATVGLLDAVSTTAAVAGACNAVRREADGRLVGDMFDGEGFVRGVLRKGQPLQGRRALVVGCGGVGSAMFTVAALSLLLRVTPQSHRGRAAATWQGGFILGGIAVLLLWGWYELRQESPLVDLRVAARPAVLFTNLASVAVGFAFFGAQITLPQRLELPAASGVGFGLSLIVASLVLAPSGLAMMATMASVDGGYLSIAPGLLVLAAGMGLSMTPSTTAITESLPVEKQVVALVKAAVS